MQTSNHSHLVEENLPCRYYIVSLMAVEEDALAGREGFKAQLVKPSASCFYETLRGNPGSRISFGNSSSFTKRQKE